MALIKCNKCGNMVSTRAKFCPKCGNPIKKTIVCEECGQEISVGLDTCPNCGCPVKKDQEHPHNKNNGNSKSVKGKHILLCCSILFAILIIIGIICHFSIISNDKDYSAKSTSGYSTPSELESDIESTIADPTTTTTTHEFVDLGLSVKWATCNIGASSPSDYGNYYAWGETSTKLSYTVSNAMTIGIDMSIAGNPKYDAARANWGGEWRMPTEAELKELVYKCTQTKTTIDGHYGLKMTGPNGNSIFLPAAGMMWGTKHEWEGDNIALWSATPHKGFSDSAVYYYFISGFLYGTCSRGTGIPIRPVIE